VWLAALVKALRLRSASVDDIAASTGLDIRTVQAVMDGKRWPSFRTAAALAEHLRGSDPSTQEPIPDGT
jgi:hypothetical protein